MAFRFEDLEVYGRAEDCLVLAYAVAEDLPPNERYNLASQLRRAALSVVLNIAESTERRGPRDAAHFVEIALGSAVEVVACLRIVSRFYPLDASRLAEVRDEYEVLYRQLHAFRRSALAKPTPDALTNT